MASHKYTNIKVWMGKYLIKIFVNEKSIKQYKINEEQNIFLFNFFIIVKETVA